MIWLLVPAGLIVMTFLLTVLFGAPYVPSQRRDVSLSFDNLYAVGPGDTLVDIGSGDGVVLREAARRGARAIGYEINPILAVVSRLLSRQQLGVEVRAANYMRSDLPPDTTIVYLFGESYHIAQVSRWIAGQVTKLQRPIYVMSYGFTMPGHTPVRQHRAHRLYLIEPLQTPVA